MIRNSYLPAVNRDKTQTTGINSNDLIVAGKSPVISAGDTTDK